MVGRTRGQKPARTACECVSEIHKNGRHKTDASIRVGSRYEPKVGDYEARRMEERVLTMTSATSQYLNGDIAGFRSNIVTYFAVTGWLKRPF